MPLVKVKDIFFSQFFFGPKAKKDKSRKKLKNKNPSKKPKMRAENKK